MIHSHSASFLLFRTCGSDRMEDCFFTHKFHFVRPRIFFHFLCYWCCPTSSYSFCFVSLWCGCYLRHETAKKHACMGNGMIRAENMCSWLRRIGFGVSWDKWMESWINLLGNGYGINFDVGICVIGCNSILESTGETDRFKDYVFKENLWNMADFD